MPNSQLENEYLNPFCKIYLIPSFRRLLKDIAAFEQASIQREKDPLHKLNPLSDHLMRLWNTTSDVLNEQNKNFKDRFLKMQLQVRLLVSGYSKIEIKVRGSSQGEDFNGTRIGKTEGDYKKTVFSTWRVGRKGKISRNIQVLTLFSLKSMLLTRNRYSIRLSNKIWCNSLMNHF